jgi:cytochrome c-type biogenesis protein CcmH/NrfG
MSQVDKLASYGWHALKAGDFQSAAAALTTACGLAPERADLWKACGVALARIGQEVRAVQAFSLAATLAPDDIESRLCAGELMIKLLDYAGAVTMFKACMSLDPDAKHPGGVRARMLMRKLQNQLQAKQS